MAGDIGEAAHRAFCCEPRVDEEGLATDRDAERCVADLLDVHMIVPFLCVE